MPPCSSRPKRPATSLDKRSSSTAAKFSRKAWTHSPRLSCCPWFSAGARLAETRQIALAQRKSPLRICDSHGLSELRLRMRADPSDEQKTAQHHEGIDFGLFLGGECADPAIAPHPRFEELRHFGIVLEK